MHWLFDGLWATLPAWLAGHLIVFLVSWHMNPKHPLGKLFVWDTGWYRMIADTGYDAAGVLVHFFPLTPAAAGLLSTVTRLPVTIALFAVCWAAALMFGAVVHRIVVRETGDRAAARRAAWLTQLVPGAYALVLGYTEPLAGVVAAGYFLAVRRYPDREARWWTAIALGFLSGLARPTGLLLAIPGAVEGLRAVRASGWRSATAAKAALATAAPLAGLLAFLAYSKVRFHSWALPFTEQASKTNRGKTFNNPLRSFHNVSRVVMYGHQVAWMCVLLIVLFALLLPLVARKLPFSYLAWTLPLYVLAITSHNFTSLPRYVGALFPALIAIALVSRRWWQEIALIAASGALLLWTTHVAMAGQLVA
jgi:hypothetical protein